MELPLLAASLVLVAGTATGCGGGAPTDASAKDFCDAITKIAETSAGAASESPTEEQVKAIKDAFADLEEVGTPEDIPDDAREDFSGDDEKKSDAFGEYVGETCDFSSLVPEMPEMPELPEVTPSE